MRWRQQWEGGRVLAFELEMLQRFTFPFFLRISRAAIPMHSATRGTHFIEFLHAEVSVNPSLNHVVFTTRCGTPGWHQNLSFLHWILRWIYHLCRVSTVQKCPIIHCRIVGVGYSKTYLHNPGFFQDVPHSEGVERSLVSVFGWNKNCVVVSWWPYVSHTQAVREPYTSQAAHSMLFHCRGETLKCFCCISPSL